MGAAGITSRLARVSAASDLRTSRRLDPKVDMSPEAISRRLRLQSQLRAACLAWGRARAETHP